MKIVAYTDSFYRNAENKEKSVFVPLWPGKVKPPSRSGKVSKLQKHAAWKEEWRIAFIWQG